MKIIILRVLFYMSFATMLAHLAYTEYPDFTSKGKEVNKRMATITAEIKGKQHEQQKSALQKEIEGLEQKREREWEQIHNRSTHNVMVSLFIGGFFCACIFGLLLLNAKDARDKREKALASS